MVRLGVLEQREAAASKEIDVLLDQCRLNGGKQPAFVSHCAVRVLFTVAPAMRRQFLRRRSTHFLVLHGL